MTIYNRVNVLLWIGLATTVLPFLCVETSLDAFESNLWGLFDTAGDYIPEYALNEPGQNVMSTVNSHTLKDHTRQDNAANSLAPYQMQNEYQYTTDRDAETGGPAQASNCRDTVGHRDKGYEYSPPPSVRPCMTSSLLPSARVQRPRLLRLGQSGTYPHPVSNSDFDDQRLLSTTNADVIPSQQVDFTKGLSVSAVKWESLKDISHRKRLMKLFVKNFNLKLSAVVKTCTPNGIKGKKLKGSLGELPVRLFGSIKGKYVRILEDLEKVDPKGKEQYVQTMDHLEERVIEKLILLRQLRTRVRKILQHFWENHMAHLEKEDEKVNYINGLNAAFNWLWSNLIDPDNRLPVTGFLRHGLSEDEMIFSSEQISVILCINQNQDELYITTAKLLFDRYIQMEHHSP